MTHKTDTQATWIQAWSMTDQRNIKNSRHLNTFCHSISQANYKGKTTKDLHITLKVKFKSINPVKKLQTLTIFFAFITL